MGNYAKYRWYSDLITIDKLQEELNILEEEGQEVYSILPYNNECVLVIYRRNNRATGFSR